MLCQTRPFWTDSLQYSTTVWKPIIGSIDKPNIKSNDLRIKTNKPDSAIIKSAFEKELADRNIQQKIIENRLNTNNNSNHKLDDIKIDENLIKINNNFDELKKMTVFTNIEIQPNTIIESITKLDDLLSSIKNI